MTSKTVLVVGDVLTDTVVRLHSPLAVGTDAPATITDTPGGQGANVARWLIRAGVESVRLLASISAADPIDHAAELHAAGVEAQFVFVDAPVSRIVVVVDANGNDRSFLTQRGAAAQLDAAAADAVNLAQVEWCHVSGYLLASNAGRQCYARLVDRCRALGIPISVDPASVAEILALGVPTFRALLNGADVLVPNEAEARTLSGETEPGATALSLQSQASVVAVTCGPAGVVASSRATGPIRVPAVSALVVDPTGAGDAFAAGLIAGLVKAAPLVDAIQAGVRLAGSAVSMLGAAPR